MTAIILLERGLGGAGTVLLGAIGFLLALGTYDVSAYLWLEGAFVLGTIVLMFLFFARSARPLPRADTAAPAALPCRPPAPRVLRGRPPLPRARPLCWSAVFVFTTAIQAVRVLSIWAAGKAVGIELGPRIYYVMGPLFFLVLLVPFTLNGIAVREAFFVSFLGSVGVPGPTRPSRPASSSSSSPPPSRLPGGPRSCSGRGSAEALRPRLEHG